jgi:hypothetical protein
VLRGDVGLKAQEEAGGGGESRRGEERRGEERKEKERVGDRAADGEGRRRRRRKATAWQGSAARTKGEMGRVAFENHKLSRM